MAEEPRKEEEVQPTPVPWKEFLEFYPINTNQIVSGYYAANPDQNDRYYTYVRLAPPLRLYCPNCEGIRNFVGKWEQEAKFGERHHYRVRAFLSYTCKDCEGGFKTYCLLSGPLPDGNNGIAVKLGEYPEVHIEVPKSLQPLLGDDYHLFLKGLTCEKQGLGVGAFTYYRRVVDSQKSRLIEKIVEVAQKLNAPKETLDVLTRAAQENQFSRAVETVRDAIPPALFVDSQNPLKLLYNALSIGLHDQTDENCLKVAHAVRLVLADFSERLKLALEDQKELRVAIGGLAKFIGDAKKNNG